MAGVYWIGLENHTDIFSQGYVGISRDPEMRWKYHSKRKENFNVRYAIHKFGWDKLVKKVIIEADIDYCLEMEAKLRPTENIGWNIAKGGGKPPNVPWNKGVPADPAHIKRMNKIRLSKPNHRIGVVLSNETKAKIGLANSGRKHTAEHIEKCRIAKIGKKQTLSTCPHCNKVGGSQTMPRWHFDNCKQKGI